MYSLRAIKGIFNIILLTFDNLDNVWSLQLLIFLIRLKQDNALSLLFWYRLRLIIDLACTTNMSYASNNKCFMVLVFILKNLTCVYSITIKGLRFKCTKPHRYVHRWLPDRTKLFCLLVWFSLIWIWLRNYWTSFGWSLLKVFLENWLQLLYFFVFF